MTGLREIVAKVAKVAPDAVTPEFSLEIPALADSIKKAVLVATIRRDLGVDCMEAVLAKTYGELERMVERKKAGKNS